MPVTVSRMLAPHATETLKCFGKAAQALSGKSGNLPSRRSSGGRVQPIRIRKFLAATMIGQRLRLLAGLYVVV